MRFSTLLLVGTVLLAGACGGSSSSSAGHDASTCSIGALGCSCTAGGACDPGGHCDPALHICVSNVGGGGAGGGGGLDAGAGNGGVSGTGAAGSAGASGSGGSSGGTAGAGGSGTAGTGGLPDGIGILPCGNTTCTAPQACCYKHQQVAGSSTYQSSWTCIDPSTTSCTSCTGTKCVATLIECHGKRDCSAGETCCGTLNAVKSGYTSLKCYSQCPAQSGTMCDPNDGLPCPVSINPMTCSPTTGWLPGYYNCI